MNWLFHHFLLKKLCHNCCAISPPPTRSTQQWTWIVLINRLYLWETTIFSSLFIYLYIFIYIYKREKGVGRRGVESGRARDWRELNFTAKSNCFPIANELGRQQMDRRSYLVFNACSLIDSKKFWFLFEICDCPPADASDKLLFFFCRTFLLRRCVCVCVCVSVCQCVRYPFFKHLQNVKWRNSDEIWTSLSASLNRRTLVQSQFLANFFKIIYLVAVVVVAVVFAMIFFSFSEEQRNMSGL